MERWEAETPENGSGGRGRGISLRREDRKRKRTRIPWPVHRLTQDRVRRIAVKMAGGVGVKNGTRGMGPESATHLFEKKQCKLSENSDTKF